MSTILANDPKRVWAEHLAILRGYARRILLQDGFLTPSEEADRAKRIRELVAISHSFRLTGQEMVAQLYKGLLTPKRGCDCPTCRTRGVRGK